MNFQLDSHILTTKLNHNKYRDRLKWSQITDFSTIFHRTNKTQNLRFVECYDGYYKYIYIYIYHLALKIDTVILKNPAMF